MHPRRRPWTAIDGVSGLSEELRAPGARHLRAGCCKRQTAGGWRRIRARSPWPAPVASLAAAANAPVVLARGERDPMVSLEELRTHARQAYDIPGAGHNVHVEDPRAVLGLIEPLLKRD